MKIRIEDGIGIADIADFIGEGAFREAYAFGKGLKYIVKIPHQTGFLASEANIEHQLNEIRIWQRLPDSLKHFFVPVLNFDPKGRWLVMPRVLSKELSIVKRNQIVEL